MSVATAKTQTPKRNKRSAWWWLLYGLLFIIFIAACIAAYAWLNRYSLLESAAEDLLLEQGIRAELSIESVSKTQAVLKKIKLSDETSEFFSADKIIADYAWREALEGRVDKLELTKPKARITIDKTGKVIDGWLPPKRTDSGEGTALPPQGIIIKEGRFDVTSPFGVASADIDATIFSQTDFNAAVKLAPSTFSYGDWRMEGGGDLDIQLKGDSSHVDVDLALLHLSHPDLKAEALNIKGAFMPDIKGDVIKASGDINVSFESLIMPQANMAEGNIKWDGRLERDSSRNYPLAAEGDWQADIAGVSLSNTEQRRSLSKTLSLSDALLNAPIAQNFSADLTRNIERLLTKSDVKASGRLQLSPAGADVSLTSAAELSNRQTKLVLRQTDWAPLYRYERIKNKLRLAFHAALTRPVGLKLNEAEMVASTPNGWSLTGVEKFSADVSTSQIWTSKGADGQTARLSPFAAQAVYDANETPRKMTLIGGIDYDGSLPGGYVTSLKTAGRMTMNLHNSGLSVTFKPSDENPIKMTRFVTGADWRGENISANLVSTQPLFSRRGGASYMDAKLSNVSFDAIDSTDSKNLDMTFDAMDVSGELKDGAQRWDVLGQNAQILSEDTPGPGTIITAPEARIQITRVESNMPMQFYMAAPKATAKTQLVNATNIRVEAAGTPEAYTLNYSPGIDNAGRVKFMGDAIPRLPMTGAVDFEDGAFTGTATTTLPLADDTPINVSYYFKDGQGTADVDIPELRFTPKGLQPQYLVSALRGKLAEVDGLVQANIKLKFAAGQPLQSSGSAKIIDMNFGTLPGPLTGVNTEIQFTNMFPLQSESRQRLTVGKFDPGFPLENGEIEFELIPDGVKVFSARWPLGDGFLSLDPFEWLYSNDVNRVVMRIENVSIGEFLKDVGDGDLRATGDIEGTLPIVLSGVDVKVEKGELYVRDGGVIQYKSKQLDSISELDGTNERAVAAMRAGNYRDAAFEALKNFEYQELRVKIDGALDGPIDVFLKADGKNEDVLGGQPFLFNINLQGELLNILRSFNTNAQIKAELARKGLLKDLDTTEEEQQKYFE